VVVSIHALFGALAAALPAGALNSTALAGVSMSFITRVVQACNDLKSVGQRLT